MCRAYVIFNGVMVEIVPPRGMHIFHVMPARQKHLDRMGDRRE